MNPAIPKTYKKNFDLPIPTIDGNGVAEIVSIEVEVWKDPDTDEEILTSQSSELIETIRARRMGLMLPG